MVGAARFELATPSPPDFAACNESRLFSNGLLWLRSGVRDFFRDFLDLLQRGGNLVLENVRVLGRSLDIGMAECVLDQFQIAGLSQELGRKVMAKVMNPETVRTRGDAGTPT